MGMMRMFLMRLLLLLSHCPDQSAALEVALTLAGEVMHVSVDEPLQRSDRRSIAEAALRSHRNLLSRLPTGICSDDDGEKNGRSVCEVGSPAHLDAWLNEVVWQVEAALVRAELQHMDGKHWDLVSFWRGRGFSNEANRMILREVVTREPKFFSNASALLRRAILTPFSRTAAAPPILPIIAPFAAAAHTLAQILFDHHNGSFEKRADSNQEGWDYLRENATTTCTSTSAARIASSSDEHPPGGRIQPPERPPEPLRTAPRTHDEEEAAFVLRGSVLNVPGHISRHEPLFRRNFKKHKSVDASTTSNPTAGTTWEERVQRAPLEIVVVATKLTPELKALERSAAAFCRSDTDVDSDRSAKERDSAEQPGVKFDYRPYRVKVLGLGRPWPGFGLKISLLNDHLQRHERKRRHRRQQRRWADAPRARGQTPHNASRHLCAPPSAIEAEGSSYPGGISAADDCSSRNNTDDNYSYDNGDHDDDDDYDDDEPLVLFLDAYDVLLLDPFRHIKRRFMRQRAAVLFGAEIDTAPDTCAELLYDELLKPSRITSGGDLKVFLPTKIYQGGKREKIKQEIKYPFLNSGSILGLASDMATMLQDVLEDLDVNHARAVRHSSQSFFFQNQIRSRDQPLSSPGSADAPYPDLSSLLINRTSDQSVVDHEATLEDAATAIYYERNARLSMDVEDQRWFTRYFLRYGLTFHGCSTVKEPQPTPESLPRSRSSAAGCRRWVDSSNSGSWLSFVAIDSGGRIFQTTHRSAPADFRLGEAGYTAIFPFSDGKIGSTTNGGGESGLASPMEPSDAGSGALCSDGDISSLEMFGVAPEDGREKETFEAIEAVEDGYGAYPAGRYFRGAGLVWNRRARTTPCLLHGNDWKQLVFNAVTKALHVEGWPPQPLTLSILPSSRNGQANKIKDTDHEDRSAKDHFVEGEKGDEFSRRLVVRWTDGLRAKLYAWQESHDMWLPHNECGKL